MISSRGATIKVYDETIGEYVYIQSKQIESIEICLETEKNSKNLPISYCNIVLRQSINLTYLFNEKKEVEIYYNGKLHATFFVKFTKKQNWNNMLIYCENIFSLLSEEPFGLTKSYINEPVNKVLEDILNETQFEYEIDKSFESKLATGLAPFGTIKDVLLRTCFAFDALVIEKNKKIYIKNLSSNTAIKSIPSSRIVGTPMQKENNAKVFKLNCPYFVYGNIDDDLNSQYSLYSFFEYEKMKVMVSNDRVILSTDIPINLQKAVRLYRVLERDSGSVVSQAMTQDVDYKITFSSINKIEFTLLKYLGGEKRVVFYGADIDAVDAFLSVLVLPQNTGGQEVNIERNGFIVAENVDAISQKILNDHITSSEVNCKVVEGKHVQEGDPYKYGDRVYGSIAYGQLTPSTITYDEPIYIGDRVNVDLNQYGAQNKIVVRQKYNLIGGIVIKETTLK